MSRSRAGDEELPHQVGHEATDPCGNQLGSGCGCRGWPHDASLHPVRGYREHSVSNGKQQQAHASAHQRNHVPTTSGACRSPLLLLALHGPPVPITASVHSTPQMSERYIRYTNDITLAEHCLRSKLCALGSIRPHRQMNERTIIAKV
eukprot:1790190-Pyramimonas_sp.AAC.1